MNAVPDNFDPDEAVIDLREVWKIFGDRSAEAMEAIKARGLTKSQVLDEFDCVVGVADASFQVRKRRDFLHHGTVGQWQIHPCSACQPIAVTNGGQGGGQRHRHHGTG